METLTPLPPKLEESTVIELMPPVMLLKVLFVIVLVGPLALLAPFESLKARTAVMPVKVTFEKLFRLYRMVDPFGDESPPPLVKKVTVPPALALLKPVTMLLLLMERLPVAVMLTVW